MCISGSSLVVREKRSPMSHGSVKVRLLPGDSGVSESEWREMYETAAGLPLSVARWVCYRITPHGHEIMTWPLRPGHRIGEAA